MTKKIVALAGDGIGPEIMEAGLAVLEALASKTGFDYVIDRRPFGGAGIDAEGHPLPDETLKYLYRTNIGIEIEFLTKIQQTLFRSNCGIIILGTTDSC